MTAGTNLHQDLTDTMKMKVAMSDRYVVTKDNWESISTRIKHQPLFSSYYVIEIIMKGLDKRDLTEIVETTKSDYVQLIFNCSDMKSFEQLETIKDIDILEFNGYKPPEVILFKYMQNRLTFNLTEQFFHEIKNRLRGNYNLIDMYLNKLNENPPNELKDLKKIVPKLSKTSLWVFFKELLAKEEHRKVYKVVEDYSFGGKFLLEYIQDNLEGLIELHGDYAKGYFNGRTLTEYTVKNKDRIKKLGFKEYQLSDVLEIFRLHSIHELVITKRLVDESLQKLNEVGIQYSLYLTVGKILNLKTTLSLESEDSFNFNYDNMFRYEEEMNKE